MKTYWEERAQVTRSAAILIGELIAPNVVGEAIRMTEKDDLLTEDEKAEVFSTFMVTLAKTGVFREDRLGDLLASHTTALIGIAEVGGIEHVPHCDRCATDPRRPVTYWDHHRWIDEQLLLGSVILLTDGASLTDKFTIAKVMVDWRRKKRGITNTTRGDRSMNPLRLDSRLMFGKHKGEQIEDLIEDDPSYLAWCVSEDMGLFDDEVIRKLEERKII